MLAATLTVSSAQGQAIAAQDILEEGMLERAFASNEPLHVATVSVNDLDAMDPWTTMRQWELSAAFLTGYQEDTPFDLSTNVGSTSDRLQESDGISIAASRYSAPDSPWGWGGSLRLFRGKQSSVVRIGAANRLVDQGDQGSVAGSSFGETVAPGSVTDLNYRLLTITDRREYESSLIRLQWHRLYRQTFDVGERTWSLGLRTVHFGDQFEFSQETSDFFPQPETLERHHHRADNWMVGPQAGIEQRWPILRRLEVGASGNVGALYNWSTLEMGSDESTDHSFSLSSELAAFIAVQVAKHGQLSLGYRRTLLQGQRTVIEPDDRSLVTMNALEFLLETRF